MKTKQPELLNPEQAQDLHEFLGDHHEAFCLEEHERGETDLITMEIDTGDARPQKQPARRMPFAVRREVAKQLSNMQKAGVIQPSSSPVEPTSTAVTPEADTTDRPYDSEPENDDPENDIHSESEDSDTDSEIEDKSQPQAQSESAGVITRSSDPCSDYALRKRVTAPARFMQIRSGRACSERGVM